MLPAILVIASLLQVAAETLLVLLQLSLELLVRIPDGLDLEQAINLLQRNTTGFGDEEEGKEEGTEGQGSEEEVDTEVHTGKHLLGEPSDQEVEEPVTGGGSGLTQGTKIGVEEFLALVRQVCENQRMNLRS